MPVTRFAAILLLTACAQTAVAADKRQHGSHEHGTAKLDVAVEQNALYIALDTPAANIIGFEHAPSTKEQKATLHKGISQLEAGDALFTTPQAAGCSLVTAEVESPFPDHKEHAQADKHHDHGHDAHKHDEHGHDKHDHDKHGHKKSHAKHDHHDHGDKHDHKQHDHKKHDHDAHEAHADFRASWQFECKRADKLTQLDIRLFDTFPGLQRLQVQSITSKRQGGTILTSSNPVLTF